MVHRSVHLTAVLLVPALLQVVAVFAANSDCSVHEGMQTIQQLKSTLFCNYDTFERPVRNRTANVTVDVSLEIKRINVVEYMNTNEIIAFVTVVWHDEILKWNKSDYEEISQFEVPSSSIWTPDLAVYNSDVSQSGLFKDTNCVVSHFGRVLCILSTRSPIFCEQDLKNWPRDTRICQLYVGSWNYKGNQLDLQLYYEGFTLFGYKKNYEWDMSHISVKKHITVYPCCPTEPYVYLIYQIQLSRHAALYMATVITPAFVLAGVTLMSFWIRGVTCRALVCVVTLLGNAQFLQFVARALPANGDTMPTIVTFYRDSMVLSACALLTALVVWRLNYCATPRWLENVTVWVRGRGGKTGQLLLGEDHENETNVALEKNDECSAAATLLDRAAFLAFIIAYAVLLTALLP